MGDSFLRLRMLRMLFCCSLRFLVQIHRASSVRLSGEMVVIELIEHKVLMKVFFAHCKIEHLRSFGTVFEFVLWFVGRSLFCRVLSLVGTPVRFWGFKVITVFPWVPRLSQELLELLGCCLRLLLLLGFLVVVYQGAHQIDNYVCLDNCILLRVSNVPWTLQRNIELQFLVRIRSARTHALEVLADFWGLLNLVLQLRPGIRTVRSLLFLLLGCVFLRRVRILGVPSLSLAAESDLFLLFKLVVRTGNITPAHSFLEFVRSWGSLTQVFLALAWGADSWALHNLTVFSLWGKPIVSYGINANLRREIQCCGGFVAVFVIRCKLWIFKLSLQMLAFLLDGNLAAGFALNLCWHICAQQKGCFLVGLILLLKSYFWLHL